MGLQTRNHHDYPTTPSATASRSSYWPVVQVDDQHTLDGNHVQYQRVSPDTVSPGHGGVTRFGSLHREGLLAGQAQIAGGSGSSPEIYWPGPERRDESEEALL